MKTTDSRDPLDRKIDELLRETSVRPSSDFLSRTLEAAKETEQDKPQTKKRWHIIPFALPIAAVLVLALFLSSQLKDNTTTDLAPQESQLATNDSPSMSDNDLENTEMQEILFLQQGLSGLASIESTELDDDDWLQTLDTLYFDIQS